MSKWHDLTGEKTDQILITTDQKGHPNGTATRSMCHTADGIPHLAFLAFLFNGKNKIYLQKRAGRKTLWDGFWDASVVSHVLPGETIEEAARRRGREELGVDAKFKNLGGFYYFAKYNGNCENEFCHVLLGFTDRKIAVNPVEISEVRKISIQDLLKEMNTKNEQFTPWLRNALEKYHDKLK